MATTSESKTLQSEAGFAALFEHATMGILAMEENGRIEMVNPYAARMFGYASEELIGQPLEILIPDQLRQQHQEHREKYFHRPTARPMGLNLDLKARHKNGQEFPVEISLSHYSSEGQNMAIAFISDITQRRQVEEQLRLDAERIRFLIERTPAAVAMFDENMRYILVSKRWTADYQLGDRDIIGMSHYEVFPEMSEQWKKLHRRCLAGEVIRCEEDPFLRENGRVDWVKWELCPWYNREGKVGGVILFTEVITERKKSEEKLQEMNENLEMKVQEKTKELTESVAREKELNEMKSRFVSIASHEFRTPLSTILSSVSLLEKYTLTEQQENRARHITRIKSAVTNLTNILNDFLSLDKLEQGIVVTELHAFDLKAFIFDIIEELQATTKEGQEIQYQHEGKEVVVLDKQILRNVLLNLLSNAIKYSDKNVLIDVKVDKDNVLISVIDQGIGIPEPEQAKLFERFFRAHNTGNIQGTGLGLNIVKRYLELVQGNIEFTSVQNEGTTFRVQIPQQMEN